MSLIRDNVPKIGTSKDPGPEIVKMGSAIFLEPETYVMVQFLAPEIVIMGERKFMIYRHGP